jgi:hypothetical protein
MSIQALTPPSPLGTRRSVSGGKVATDSSSQSSAEVKKVWSYTPTPPSIFMVQCLVKHRDSFTLPCIKYLMWCYCVHLPEVGMLLSICRERYAYGRVSQAF